jgi:hypothetical protein
MHHRLNPRRARRRDRVEPAYERNGQCGPIWRRWDESGREAAAVMPIITKRKANLKSRGAAPVKALASRDRVDVPTVKRRAHGDKNPRYAAALAASGSPDTSPSAHLDQGGVLWNPFAQTVWANSQQ